MITASNRNSRYRHPMSVGYTDEEMEELLAVWIAYGHKAEDIQKEKDGLRVKIGKETTLHVEPDRIEFHGPATDEAMAASMRHAQEAWGGRMYVWGPEEFKMRSWAHAQVAGVTIANYAPPDHLLSHAEALVAKCRANAANNKSWGYDLGPAPADRDMMRQIDIALRGEGPQP